MEVKIVGGRWQYILEWSVFPREAEALKEIRKATATHPLLGFMKATRVVKIGGITRCGLWGGTVAWAEEDVPGKPFSLSLILLLLPLLMPSLSA
ncbi:hypothetical protein PIB30_039871 [Stylosanthes scabra]|uniref:Uncharacterized protein n=1 Tax=Stylosanthes scabra TaxID=79078 RepID=A0ABU6VDR6_9FABA|nr:hypothetical protein [Stylosanthes scabra]